MTLDEFKAAMEEAEKLPDAEFLVKAKGLTIECKDVLGHSFITTQWWADFVKRTGPRVLGSMKLNVAMKEFSEITFDESRVGDPAYLNERLNAVLTVMSRHPAGALESRRVASLLVAWARRCPSPLPALPAWDDLEQFRPDVVNLFTRRMTEGDGCCP